MHNTVNVPNDTELYTLKRLCHVNFSSIKNEHEFYYLWKFPSISSTGVNDIQYCTNESLLQPGERGTSIVHSFTGEKTDAQRG